MASEGVVLERQDSLDEQDRGQSPIATIGTFHVDSGRTDAGAKVVMERQMRVPLSAFETPQELEERIESHCATYGFTSARDRAYVEESMKLRFHFGGKVVAFLTRAGDSEIEIIGEMSEWDSEDVNRQITALKVEERQRLSIDFIAPVGGHASEEPAVSRIKTPFLPRQRPA